MRAWVRANMAARRPIDRPVPRDPLTRGSAHHRSRPAGVRPVDRLVGQLVGDGVEGPRHVGRGPAIEPGEGLARRGPERDQLGVLDPPAAGQLLDDQLRIEQQVDLAGTQLARKVEGADDPRVLGDVVGLDAEIVGDRGVRDSAVIAGVRSCQVEQRCAQRGRSGVAARRPIGPDDEPAGGLGARFVLPGLTCELGEERVAQPGTRSSAGSDGPPSADGSAGPGAPPCSTGSSTCGPESASVPRILRRNHWIGS